MGGFIVSAEMAEKIEPIITGGTGSLSHEIFQPSVMPDKFESGTLNIPAILGFKKALEYIQNVGIKIIFEKEKQNAEKFLHEIEKIPDVQIIGWNGSDKNIAVISLDFANHDNAEIAAILDSEYGIMTRCGMHCAPMAHKTLGTYPQGTVRFSFGHTTTLDDVEYVASAIKKICRKED